MSANLAYAQRILSGQTFRLLAILPALDGDEPLQCECRCFEIGEAPPYEALSYVWGAQTPCVDIYCNGQWIQIGLPLACALKRLRYREATRTIWVDAICINQRDEAEKSYQVPLMGSIYALAKRVVVWLGPGHAQQTRRAFECVKLIATAFEQADQNYSVASAHWWRLCEQVHVPEELFDPLVVDSLRELFDRPWFSRVWCVQEIRLATDAHLIWGSDEVSWADLAVSASWIFGKAGAVGENESRNAVESPLVEIAVENAAMMREKASYRLLDALDQFRMFKASNPRDKVYGLLSMVSPRFEVEALDVDYNKSVGEVYADTVLAVIRLYSRLTAFAYITHHTDYDGPKPRHNNGKSAYRSWAPRWDKSPIAHPLGIPEELCPWSACGDHSATMVVDAPSTPERLCLKGTIYSKVNEVGDAMGYHNLIDPEYIGKYASGDPVRKHPIIAAFERIDANSPQERFARTLTRGCWGEADQYVQLSNEFIQTKHNEACSRFLSRLIHLQSFGDEGEYTFDSDSAQFKRDAYYACRQRRMFWTERGSYGLGPHSMRAGDSVVVLYGGNTPYVLRPRGREYIFMGQAYVDEIMNRELFQGSTSDVPEEKTFCLI